MVKAPVLERLTDYGFDLANAFPLEQVSQYLPPSVSGRRVHRNTCYRWRHPGILGRNGERIRLAATKVGALSKAQLTAFLDGHL